MKKATFTAIVAASLLMSGTLALAQEDLPRAVRVLQRFLQLSDQQVTQFLDLESALKTQVAPLRDSIRAAEEQLQSEFGSENPSAETVGNLVIQIRDLRRQIGEARQNMLKSFQDLLSEDQARRLNAARRAARLQPVLPVLKRLGLIPRRPHRRDRGQDAQ